MVVAAAMPVLCGNSSSERLLGHWRSMFTDHRSKRVVFVSHCLLNQNSISDGTADFPSQFEDLISMLMANKVGIIQMPCPELLCLGLDRGDKRGSERALLEENTRIRNLMQQEENFSALGLVGINRSPSCGIETTSIDGREEPGMGVFMQVIAEELQKEHLEIRMVGVKTSRTEESLGKVRRLLERSTLGG